MEGGMQQLSAAGSDASFSGEHVEDAGVQVVDPDVVLSDEAQAVWTDAPRGFIVHDAEFSASVASPTEAAWAAKERQQQQEEAVLQEQARQKLGRKAEILLELLAAGDGVEARIRAHSAEVDELMLQLLERRIEAAKRLDQAEGFIEAMQALLQRLQIEAQRAAATPAERLLDDALQILAGSAQMEYQARKQEVANRLSAAFTPPGSQAVDIFATAQVLAEGGAIPEKDMASEHVRQDAFLNEAQRLLEDALSTNASLQRALEEDDWPAEVGQWDEKDPARAAPPVDEQTQRLSQYWGAYMHQLQLLSQQADHQAPSASSTQSTAMLASLLASNPALLQAMQLPPAVVDAGVGATSSAATQKEAGSDVKHSVGGDAADANTAVGAASTLQLGTAGSLQTSMLVTKPKAAVAAQQPAFAPAPAAGPAPITSGGPTLTSSALRSNSASAFVAAGSVRSIELGLHSSSMNGVAHAAAAVGKRSATGDMKPVVGRRDSAALPPKKRLDAAGDSTGDAERDAYSSLARMRSAGEGSTATRSEDGNEADEGAGAAGCSALAAIKDSKEKNRQAQRRFRERQKSLIGDLRESVTALTRETEAQSKQIYVLQEENRLLKVLLQERSKPAQS